MSKKRPWWKFWPTIEDELTESNRGFWCAFALLAFMLALLALAALGSGCGARSSVTGGESYLKTLSETTPGSTTTTVTEKADLTPEGKPAATTTTRQVQVVPPTTKKETEARAVGGKSEISGEDVKQAANISAPKVTGPGASRKRNLPATKPAGASRPSPSPSQARAVSGHPIVELSAMSTGAPSSCPTDHP